MDLYAKSLSRLRLRVALLYTVNPEIIATIIFNDICNPGTLTSLNDNVF